MEKYSVKFVGAGPGDPELITIKGQKALKNADMVIYAGSLVPEAVVCWAKPGTQLENSASMHLDQIIALIKIVLTREKKWCGFIPAIQVFMVLFSSRCLCFGNWGFPMKCSGSDRRFCSCCGYWT
jgi:hypothetical protein